MSRVPVEGQCIALVSSPHYWHKHRCTNTAKFKVGRHKVCGIHKRVAERWQKEGRLDSMVRWWWDKHIDIV